MVKTFTRMLMITMLFGAMSLSVTACNTMEGIGEDTRAAGEAISNASRSSGNSGY
ncbi:MAG: entericidin A/B family lipoprotein [Pseudomonadota bacterium]